MITQETILALLKEAGDPSISIYLPTHVKGEQVQQDPIRFKNLLKKAEKQLHERKVDQSVIDSLLEKPRKLLDQPLFWQHAERGLAVFITRSSFEQYRVPLKLKEQVMVEDHFLITPLLPMITLDGSYCMLALSQKEMRLLRCTRQQITRVKLEESPSSLNEFLQYDVNEKNLQHYSVKQGGKTQSIFHGQGGAEETNVEELINYLKTVENEVTTILRKRNDPLILIGVDEAVAEYRKINHYSRLIEEAVTVNPDPLSDEKINKKGWKVIKKRFLEGMYNDMGRFADLTGSGKQSGNLSQVVEGSYYGKVDTLFVPIGERSWGWFDTESDTVHHSAEQQNGEHDLINMAAIKTLTQGGDVYALEKEDMPQKASIAAIFRYA
jgi:hypothetical protein